MAAVPANLLATLTEHQQTQVLRWWDQLNASDRTQLIRQLELVEFPLIRQIWQQASQQASGTADSCSRSEGSRADRAAAPRSVVRRPDSDSARAEWAAAARVGEDLLQRGRVAVVTVAGGQGSRLGFEHPKGMFPIGPVTGRTLFQIFAEQILALRRRHGAALLWMIMTSDATHEETVGFFREHDFFGLGAETVEFFRQGSLPAVDAATGRLLMCGRADLCLSPDGHGGLVNALRRSGMLRRMHDQGIEHIFYHQVDNPTVVMCSAPLLGFHLLRNSELTTVAVRKLGPSERMGVLVAVDEHTEIIEYSELTAEQAARSDASGQWVFWAGNTAIHVFTRCFLERLADSENSLPLHVARKNVAFLDEAGRMVQPADSQPPNAIKFERFIFDALPLAGTTLIVEGDRAREFNPVKNHSGADSPGTAREALSRIGREWLAAAGVAVDPAQPVEISPLTALDPEELSQKIERG